MATYPVGATSANNPVISNPVPIKTQWVQGAVNPSEAVGSTGENSGSTQPGQISPRF